MITKKQLNSRIDKTIKDSNVNFEDIFDYLKEVSTELYKLKDLRDEIENNGVVRDLRKLQKENAELKTFVNDVRASFEDKFLQLENNGVATAINKINKELFQNSKEKQEEYGFYYGYKKAEEPTIAGKVEAIIEHLGLDFEVKPEKVISKKVEVKKVKKTKKVIK